MKDFDSLESLTFYREKLILPNNKQDKNKGSLMFAMHTSLDSIVEIFNNEHPMLYNQANMYKTYFYNHMKLPDCIKSTKVKTKVIKPNQAKAERLTTYNLLKDKCNNVKTPITFGVANERNMIYDLMPIEKLYRDNNKLKTLPIRASMMAFLDTFTAITDTKLPGYETKCILVNLDELSQYTTKYKNIHIINILMVLLRRSEKFLESFKNYDMKFLFYTKKGYFLFDFKKDLDKANLPKLRMMLKKTNPTVMVDMVADSIEKEEIAKKMNENAIKRNATGDEMSINIEDEIGEYIDSKKVVDADDKIIDAVNDKIDDVEDLEDEDKMNEIESEIFGDEETKKEYMSTVVQKKTNQKSERNLKRDQELREKQKNIMVKTKTIGELEAIADIPDIKEDTVKKLPETYMNTRNMKFKNFEKTYMDTMYEKHVTEMITCLNNKTIPVNIVSINVEDTSDNLTMKETYTVVLEDERRVRHTLKFNMPKFIDDKFLYVNGNKKTIQKQFFCYPVVKTGPDQVQVVTNYNKIFIDRVGAKFSQNSERFRKLTNDEEMRGYVTTLTGCNTLVNKDYLTCLEYDELAKSYNRIEIGNAVFVFNMKILEEELGGQYHSSLDSVLIGYKTEKGKKVPIYYDMKDPDHPDLISVMVDYLPEDKRKKFHQYTVGKKYVHTTATIMTRKVPVIILLSFFEGLQTVIRKFDDPTVVFSDKKDKGDNYMYIKFTDGYLCYPMANMEACMLFNGLTEINTGAYTIDSMNERPTYLDIFQELLGTSYVAGGFINYYDFMIDPITLEVLELLQYPTDIVSLMIFANNMLADNDYISDINLNQYRLRENEIVVACLYKNIARAYSRYRQTANNPNPVKISMDENAVIKEIMALPTVEDYSTLSPMVEMHKGSIVSMKGANGLNMDRAYKLDKRAFDDSMIGVCGISTATDSNCGKIKQLVAEPTVTNALGFMALNNKEDVDKLSDVNLSVPVEMLTPMSSTHDNSTRNAMATKQTCHVIPVANGCPVLISNGMDQAIHYRTGNDFSVVAKQDGKVVEYDEKNNIMVVQYKDGSHQAIDIAPHAVKNGGGGFYLVNKLTSKYRKGQSFNKDDILAYDPKYYKDQGQFGNRLTMGSLMKVACISNFSTFEDSAFITKHMSEQMGSDVTMQKTLILGANANVDYMVKVGDKVRIGDDLIRYETSYDDSELNRLLSNVRDDMKEEIVNLGRSKLTSSYTGYVSDIMIYCTVDNDELSPSLRKIVKSFQDSIKSKEKVLDKYDNNPNAVYRMGVLMNKPSGKMEPDEYGKLKGHEIGAGVLIEFYITFHDELSDGDKLAAFTANKNTIGYQVPRGYEPYSTFRPYEEISAPVAPSAILQRNTPSMVTTGCVYKILIELKRKQYEILTGENYDEVLKQKQPYMVRGKKPTVESVTFERQITDEEISVLESVHGFDKESGHYKSAKCYLPEDMIMPLQEGIDMTSVINNFKLSSENYNAIYDRVYNMIIATEQINPYDDIIVNPDPYV